MTQLEKLSFSQTISKIDALIDNGNGDAGRLYYIMEFLKNNKPLYRSDKIYLENKLESSFSMEDEPVEENDLLPKIQELIDSGNGDSGRLQSIYDALSKNKQLYNSDANYLESKLHSMIDETIVAEPPKKLTTNIPKTAQEIVKPALPQKIKSVLPKGWSQDIAFEDVENITQDIEKEQQKIKTQEKISDEINQQRANLSQLISHRKEYEQKITREKSLLESQIKEERIRIETQTKFSNEIISQKEELEKVKKERAIVIGKIALEKNKISKDLLSQKKQLVEAQLEQEKIEKQIISEQELLAKMALKQKARLLEQAQIAHEIKSKQTELNKTKQDYDDIVSQVNEEKVKFTESQKLKKLIKSQEEDLIRVKKERLNLISTITAEKELISKKTDEEKLKLKSQIELTKQLKKEEKSYDLLKKKREKIESQIKIKNQKLKEKQQKLKKQINEKNKKLKSIAKKPVMKKAVKKPVKRKTSVKK